MVKVRNWNVVQTQGVLQAQSLGDTDALIVPDVRSISGGAEILYYADAVDSSGSNVTKLLQNNIKTAAGVGVAVTSPSQAVRLALVLNDGSSRGRRLSFGAYITSFTLGITVGDVVQASIQFQADGAPQEMTL
jgi:hypothetical protein